jgi:HAD superfamily phosphoserine phosphatase-like hydrolase
MATNAPLLITDFDGTIAREDFYDLVRTSPLLPPDTPDFWGMFLAGELTHFQALNEIFIRIRASDEALMALVWRMDVDPDLGAAVRRLQAAGWEIVVVSAGCCWYIERLLAEAGVSLPVYANPGTFSPKRGLEMRLPVESPYFKASTGINKVAIVQEAVETRGTVAFAGDGPPDLPPALLVPATRRFARGWLADTLRERGEAFHHFSRWSEIADVLVRR